MAKFFRVPFAAVGDREEIPDETQGTGAVSYPEGFGFDYERDPATDPAAKRVPRKQTNQYLYDITDNLRQYQLFGSPEWVPASENGGEPVVYAANARVLFDGKLYRALQMTSAQPGVGGTWREEEPFNLAALRASTAQAQAGTDNATLMTPLRVKEAIAAQTTTLTPAQILAALLTVDGPGSGLDADLLDGYHASAFARLTGAIFTGDIGLAKGFYLRGYTASNANTRLLGLHPVSNILYFGGVDQPVDDIYFVNNGAVSARLSGAGTSAVLRVANHMVWSAGNDGAGSGLDADLLDGLHANAFLRNLADTWLSVGGIPRLFFATGTGRSHLVGEDRVIIRGAGADGPDTLVVPGSGPLLHAGATIWDAGNDGAGSGLDADMLDGLHASAFARLSGAAFTGAISVPMGSAFLFGSHPALSMSSNGAGLFLVSGTGNFILQNAARTANNLMVDNATGNLTARGKIISGGHVEVPEGSAFVSNGKPVLREASGGTWLYSAGESGYTFRNDANSATLLSINNSTGVLSRLGFTVWDAGNDGSGSGLDADLLDGLHASAFLKTADFSQSLTTSGYCKLPNGVIMQWGRFTALIDATTTVNFPIVFPNLCGGVTVSGTLNWSGSAEDNAPNVKSGSVLPNKFEVWNAENSSVTVYYVALGF